MRYKNRFINDSWCNRRLLMASVVSALLLLVISYFIDMMPYAIGGELSAGQWIERTKALYESEENVPDSVLFVNIAYDKQLVPFDALIDETDDSCNVRIPAGNTAITDRFKLLRFLTMAKKLNSYKYIMLDVRFEEGLSVPAVDDSLFNLLLSMERIVIPCHRKINLSDSRLYQKAAYSDYMNTFLESGFMKYPLTKDGTLSIPAKMCEEQSNFMFSKFGPLCFENGRLCRNALFLTFPVRFYKWVSDDGIYNYYNLGTDIIEDYGDNISGLVDDKIVVIGDFVNDIHSTYVGTLPGAVINLNAYIALSNGAHLIKPISVLLLFIFYFAISAVLLKRRNLLDYLPFYSKRKSGFVHFVISFIGISTALFVFSTFYYIVLNEHINILVPSFYFTILATSIKSRVLDIKV